MHVRAFGSFIIITNECRYTNDLLCNRLSKWMAMEIKPHEVGGPNP